jgi:hypothetical protein
MRLNKSITARYGKTQCFCIFWCRIWIVQYCYTVKLISDHLVIYLEQFIIVNRQNRKIFPRAIMTMTARCEIKIRAHLKNWYRLGLLWLGKNIVQWDGKSIWFFHEVISNFSAAWHSPFGEGGRAYFNRRAIFKSRFKFATSITFKTHNVSPTSHYLQSINTT